MQFLLRYGVFAVFVIMLVIFSVLRPGTFLQIDTLRAILVDAAVLGVVASALTLVLAIGEFDLSFGNVAGLAGAIAVYSMYMLGLPVPIAILLALIAGLAAGAISGMIVAHGKVPALIATLAVGSMALGLERAVMNDNTVYDGIPPGYVALTETSFAGLPLIVIISILVVIALSLISSFTVFGRRIYAIGGSDEAARIAGIRTKRVRWLTFVVMGLTAAFAGILLTSQAGSYYPNSGVGLLLPAFAACFLGWSAAGANRFYPAYTYFGVLFMGTLSTGLIMLQVPSWVDNFVQGAVLVSAVLVARAARTR
ncbi:MULTISPECIES: ABC transporter permease [unclassified Mesorhizobium]|uniref:ABC transporter permease n=1 Tax=unclassified Mesorhizobium TaxID=325217 RepID=UPI0015E4917A|nr:MULTISPECIES: ABC transporter permease [unclassified Mesorhizobium]BCG90187.1 sugar ABC transporter permease [Mesorhizobium sp. 113-3-9]